MVVGVHDSRSENLLCWGEGSPRRAADRPPLRLPGRLAHHAVLTMLTGCPQSRGEKVPLWKGACDLIMGAVTHRFRHILFVRSCPGHRDRPGSMNVRRGMTRTI